MLVKLEVHLLPIRSDFSAKESFPFLIASFRASLFEVSRGDPSCGVESVLLVRGTLFSASQEKTPEMVAESFSAVRDLDVPRKSLATSSSVCDQCPSAVGTDLKFTVFFILTKSLVGLPYKVVRRSA